MLPHSTKTELVISANMREWRLVFKQRALRSTGRDSGEMEVLMQGLLQQAKLAIPVVFDDLIVCS